MKILYNNKFLDLLHVTILGFAVIPMFVIIFISVFDGMGLMAVYGSDLLFDKTILEHNYTIFLLLLSFIPCLTHFTAFLILSYVLHINKKNKNLTEDDRENKKIKNLLPLVFMLVVLALVLQYVILLFFSIK